MTENDIKQKITKCIPPCHVMSVTNYGPSYDIIVFITDKTPLDLILELYKVFCVFYFVITPIKVDEIPLIKLNFSIKT